MTPAEKSRAALQRFRDSVDLEDIFEEDEITQNHHWHLPAPPNVPVIAQPTELESEPTKKLKGLIISGGMALGTGIVLGLLKHCG